MATLNPKVAFKIGGYVLGKWVLFITPDFASDGQKRSNLQ
jgi:hypothetical protein